MKEKFEYEIKDFKPCIKKVPMSRRKVILISITALLIAAVLITAVVRQFFYREKLSPEEAVRRVIDNAYENIIGGRSSYAGALGMEKMLEGEKKRFVSAEGYLKLKELGDFGLGAEEFLKGININVDAFIDGKEKLSEGNLTLGWTLFTVNLLDFVSTDEKVYFSSSDFLEETLFINKSELLILDTPIEELYRNYTGKEMQTSEYESYTFRELLRMAGIEAEYSELDDGKIIKTTFGEVKCFGYRILLMNELFSSPVEVVLYADKDYNLLELTADYSIADEDGIEDGISLKITFHEGAALYDVIEGSLRLYAGSDEIKGKFSACTTETENSVGTDFVGELHVDGINLSANVNFGLDKSTGELFFESVMTDEVSVLEINTDGKALFDEDNNKLVLSLNGFNVEYDEKLIFTVNAKLTLGFPEKMPDIVIPEEDDRLVNVFDMTVEQKDRIIEQIMEKAKYYKKLLGQLM